MVKGQDGKSHDLKGQETGTERAEKSVILQLIHTARLQRTRAAFLLQEIGLFPGQEQVLQSLWRRETALKEPVQEIETGGAANGSLYGMAMGDLAAELRVRAPTVSKTVARLSAQGLVERRGAGTDKRQVYVTLTPEGRKRADAIDAITSRLENELTDGLDAKDRKRFRKLLRKAAKNLAAAAGDQALVDGEDGED